jgi:hypothetical protein
VDTVNPDTDSDPDSDLDPQHAGLFVSVVSIKVCIAERNRKIICLVS